MRTTAGTLEFLPALLELEQTPPLLLGRATLWMILLVFTFVIDWAVVGSVDIVGIAPGKIVPSGQVKSVQPLESGIVRKIFVTEGDAVRAGDLLVLLDDTQATIDFTRHRQEQRALHVEQIRLYSQLAALERYVTAGDYFTRATASNILAMTDSAYRISTPRVIAKLNEYYESLARLEQERARNRAERFVLESRIDQLDATIPLVAERVAAIQRLEERSMAPRVRWLELREQLVQKETEKGIIEAQFFTTDAAMKVLYHERAAIMARTRSTWLFELAETEARLKAVNQDLLTAEKRIAERRLVAPVAGIVHQLKVHTVGGVVAPAETLMLIVPTAEPLRVDAWISNKDVGFIERGQRAEIKIETFPFTKYGVIAGTVTDISGDAVADETRGLVYLAQVQMARTDLEVNGKPVALSPGMAVTAEVQLGKRRIIEFLLSPLLRYKDESLTER